MNLTKATGKHDGLSGDPRIRDCYPVSGDWFRVSSMSTDHLGERAWIQRVALWALVEKQHSADDVQGICDGMPAELVRDELGHEVKHKVNYVYGPDMSPFGKTWAEIYNEASPINGEVTHLMQASIRMLLDHIRLHPQVHGTHP